EAKGPETMAAIIKTLIHTDAEEGCDIAEHLNKLKSYWEKINCFNDEDFHISDPFFKAIILMSLPYSWDAFTLPYIGGRKGVAVSDPRSVDSQMFIGILMEE
ncbi:hypothetical protein EDB86DRAFT_2750669, partial [Lactarius hatsudake]